MIAYPICEKFVNDELNSGDKYFLEIEIGLKKDKFDRNVFIISYIPENLDFYGINRIIEKNYSIEKILEKYGFDKDDEKIKKHIKNAFNY